VVPRNAVFKALTRAAIVIAGAPKIHSCSRVCSQLWFRSPMTDLSLVGGAALRA
jgi:hypothetical protein